MSVLNWIALGLSLVLWMIGQNIGHGVGMASSAPIKKGSAEDVYLDRVQVVGAIAAFGALFTFVSQLIPIPIVKTVGLVILAISFLSVALLFSGLLRFRLPEPDVTAEDQVIIQSRIEKRLSSEGWTARKVDERTTFWSRPENRESTDPDVTEGDQ
jgi:hypothetical protein